MEMTGFKTAEGISVDNLIEILAPCMDDYLYIYNIQKSTMKISPTAVDRFGLESCVMQDATELLSVVYEEDRELLKNNLWLITEGKAKEHNLHYRWLDKHGKPVWINCRGVVLEDADGRPTYLVGCLNETGIQRRADNNTGLLSEMEFWSYIDDLPERITTGFFMHIGIDDFALINSAKGVEYGDYVLNGVANCIRECLSPDQRLYYLVGDQFLVVDLESSGRESASELRDLIHTRINKFIIEEKYEAVFSISVGAIDATTVYEGHEECRGKLEFSLKKAKSMGRNTFYYYTEEDYQAFLRKRKIAAALRHSISDNYNGFAVYYQPIMDCETEKMIGAEALMRFSMRLEEKEEYISPMEVIPLLEDTKLIIPAGRYILNEAAKFSARMQRFIPNFRVNVNASYIQVALGNMEQDIVDVIKHYDLDPRCLCIEMTESGFLDMTPAFMRFRKTLDKYKIQFVVDDFGTGYSNLHCISEMNPAYIKIDRDLTVKSMKDERYYELFNSIISMVHSVGINICVEGVEERAWCQTLREMRVDFLQGYLFGEPCDEQQFMERFTG